MPGGTVHWVLDYRLMDASAFTDLDRLKYLHLQENDITDLTQNHLWGLKNLGKYMYAEFYAEIKQKIFSIYLESSSVFQFTTDTQNVIQTLCTVLHCFWKNGWN